MRENGMVPHRPSKITPLTPSKDNSYSFKFKFCVPRVKSSAKKNESTPKGGKKVWTSYATLVLPHPPFAVLQPKQISTSTYANWQEDPMFFQEFPPSQLFVHAKSAWRKWTTLSKTINRNRKFQWITSIAAVTLKNYESNKSNPSKATFPIQAVISPLKCPCGTWLSKKCNMFNRWRITTIRCSHLPLRDNVDVAVCPDYSRHRMASYNSDVGVFRLYSPSRPPHKRKILGIRGGLDLKSEPFPAAAN